MRSKFYIAIILFLLVCFSSSVNAQKSKFFSKKKLLKNEKLSLTGSLGLSTYYGDLCDKFECMKFRPNLGIGFIFRLSPHISNKTELNYYRLYATDYYPERNLNFRSGNVELYTSAMYDLFPFSKHYRKRKLINPYVFLGLGFTYYNPHGTDSTGKWVALRPLETEGQHYSSLAFIIPFGGGVRVKFKRNMDIMVELGYRKTFTDHLDDVSQFHYTNKAEITDPLAQQMSMKAIDNLSNGYSYRDTYLSQQRGNPKKNDGYFLLSVKVRYILGVKNVHFKGKHPLLKPHH